MWSIGGAVLIEVVVCITVIAFAVRRMHREIEPTVRSFELLQREVVAGVGLVSRDAGRVEAGRRLLKGDQ